MNLKQQTLIFTLILTCSCTTFTPQTVSNISPLIANATYITTYELLKLHPEDRGKLEIAMAQINSLSSKTTIDLDDIWRIVNQFPIKQLKSEEAILAFNSAKLTLITLGQQKFTELRTNEQFHIVAQAMVNGLKQALEATVVINNSNLLEIFSVASNITL